MRMLMVRMRPALTLIVRNFSAHSEVCTAVHVLGRLHILAHIQTNRKNVIIAKTILLIYSKGLL
jgi:hypothetical protein